MARLLTGLSPERERAYQFRESSKLARRMERTLTREILSTMRKIAQHHGNPGRQAEALAEHKDAIRGHLERYYGRAFDLFGERVLREGEKAHPGKWETKDARETFDQIRQAWIREVAAQKVTPIAGTTEKQAQRIIQGALSEAISEGLGQAATGDKIRQAINRQGGVLARARSRVIARTETHTSANAAGQEAARATGLPMKKEWVADRDPDRTRDDHQDADEQTVDLQDYFEVGGEPLLYPGDPNGSAANIINCRCAVVYVVE